MKKRFICVLLSLITLFSCQSNDNVTPNSNSTITTSSVVSNTLPFEALTFISNVELIVSKEITLDDKDKLDGAYYIYNELSDEIKALEQVIAAKEELDQARDTFIIMYEAYLFEVEITVLANTFIEKVNELKDIDSLIREDKTLIDGLLAKYESLPQEAKELQIVIDVKSKLDSFKNRIDELINMTDIEYHTYLFVLAVRNLPNSDELTINDISRVEIVLDMYNNLDSSVKTNADVLDAKDKLDDCVNRISDLKIIKEHVDEFCSLVSKLPVLSELVYNNQEQRNQINNALTCYESLTEEEQQVDEVKVAYEKLLVIKNAFDSLKEGK